MCEECGQNNWFQENDKRGFGWVWVCDNCGHIVDIDPEENL